MYVCMLGNENLRCSRIPYSLGNDDEELKISKVP